MSLVIRVMLFPFSSRLLKSAFWYLNVCFSEWEEIILCAEHRPTQGQQDRDTSAPSLPALCHLQCHLQGERAHHLQCSHWWACSAPGHMAQGGWFCAQGMVASAGGQGKGEQSRRMVWVGKDFQDCLVPTPFNSFHYSRMHQLQNLATLTQCKVAE